jgi:helix-turn-helix protein
MKPSTRQNPPLDTAQQSARSFEVSEPLLTQTEAATILHVEPRTLESWRQHRVGPRYIRYSRRCVRYRVEDLRDWLQSQTVETVDVPALR